jgi:general secretion pathway protein K
VLLLVLLVLTLISVLVLSWAQEWRTELRLAANFRESHQCRRLAEAGVYYALGKILEGKIAETTMSRIVDPAEAAARMTGVWQGDHKLHQLKLPGGVVEVRVEDEGGKLNLNQISEDHMVAIFTALGFAPDKMRIMVDSLLDWRSRGDQPRPFGAKSAYYLNLEPPYVCRNSALESVEELGWVRGFEVGAAIPGLGRWLTVQLTQGININSAPTEVLAAVGIPPEVAQNIVMMRQRQPFMNFQDISALQQMLSAVPGQLQQLKFLSSPFFTIRSTGMVKKKGGRQTIKAVVRIDLSLPGSWEIVSWIDDFPA